MQCLASTALAPTRTSGTPRLFPCSNSTRRSNTWATLTWNHNAHSVRVGLSLIRRRATIGQSNNPQGTFTFNGSYTGVAPGDLLEGLDATLSRNNALDQPGFRTWEPSSLTCRTTGAARPWLTLNLGLRYDIFTPYTEVHGRMSNYNPLHGIGTIPGDSGYSAERSDGGRSDAVDGTLLRGSVLRPL